MTETRSPAARNSSGNSDGRDAKGRFSPGNPGKPKGSRHKATQAVEALLHGEAEALTRKAIGAIDPLTKAP